MLQFKYPGIYTREIPSGVRTITGAPTSIALFVGPTRAGIDRRAIRLLNFGDFERQFGGVSSTSSLSYSVLHFFANGGGEAFVFRVPTKNSKPAQSSFKRDDGASNEAIRVTALSSADASNDVFVELDPFGIGANPFNTAAPLPDKKRFNFTVIDRLTGRREQFGNMSTSSTSARFASSVVGDPATGSKLVKVDVIGISKGRGFAGLVKRHHFRGGDDSHGSMFHRAPGSIGASSFPSRVFPGMRMAGHMGTSRVTVRNLEVVEVDSEDNVLLVKGAVPGPNGGYVVVRRARK